MRAALLSSLIVIAFFVGHPAQAKSQLDAATLKQLTMLEQKFFGHTYDTESDDERTQRIEKLILGSSSEGAAAPRIKKLASVTYLDTRPDTVETAPSPPASASVPSPADTASPTPTPTPVPASVAAHSPSPAPTSAPVPIVHAPITHTPAPIAHTPATAPAPIVHAPASASAPTPTPVAANMSKTSRTTSTQMPSTQTLSTQSSSDDLDIPSGKPAGDDYPHVTALEKDILGSTYVGQPLSARIVRMETKAFGAASKSDDLGERTDNLETYAEQKLHKKPFLADETTDATFEETPSPESTNLSEGSSHLQSDYPHITALENSIMGQASPSLPLEKRISAMEVKAFGKVSNSDDLSGRTDALEKYAEKTLHKKPYGADLNYETADGSGAGKGTESKGMKLLNMVGNSLLGMGTNGIGAGGIGVPGVGMMGPGASGFGGIRVRRRQAPTQEPSAADEPSGPVEDPMVRAKDPPPASTRLATRVGWCEMHVFGKTSPNLHLAERLTQLSRELKFEPGKGAMELMDHIDGLVKAAQAYKAPSFGTDQGAAAIGSTPGAATH